MFKNNPFHRGFNDPEAADPEGDLIEVSVETFTPGTPLEEARASTEALIETLGAKIAELTKDIADRQALLSDYRLAHESYKLALANMNKKKEKQNA